MKAFQEALRSIKGAGGMDGWRRHDLRVFAAVEEISSTVWEAMESWELSGITPSILRHAKVACVGEDKPVFNGAMKPSSFRPISVLSGLWRAWSTTWLHVPSMQSWCKKTFFLLECLGLHLTAWDPKLLRLLLIKLSMLGATVSLWTFLMLLIV